MTRLQRMRSDDGGWAMVMVLATMMVLSLLVALALGATPGQSNEAGARLTFASGTAILAAPLLLGALADAVGIRLASGVVPIFILGALMASRLGRHLSQERTVDLVPR